MPTEQYINPPFPSGAYNTFGDDGTRGLGPVNVSGIQEWSAGKSPYYAIGDAVSFNGLVYKLNYNWDGTTVGSPDSQVDSDGVRVWTLDCSNYNTGVQFNVMGYRGKTINTDSTFYYTHVINNSIKYYWNFWHNITSAHATVFELTPYKSNTESGYGRNLLTLASVVEINPVKHTAGSTSREFQSINFNDANGIDNKMFGFVTSSCGNTINSASYVSPVGVFQYYGNYKKNLNFTDVGTLYYEAPFTYTLATTDWILSPEYNATAYGPSVTINWSYTAPSGTGYGETRTVSDLKMRFAGETFLGRTYSGAYRIYIKDNVPSEGRWELDTVTPDMRTM